IGRNIVMGARVRGGFADRVRLMPASQRPPDLAQEFLRNVTGKAGIDREQQDEIMNGRALLDCEGAVHVSLADAQLRIEEELGFEAGLVNADGGDRSGEFAAENVEPPRGVVQAQGAVLDDFFQQVRQQSHDAIPAQTKWLLAIISRYYVDAEGLSARPRSQSRGPRLAPSIADEADRLRANAGER